MQRDRNRDEAPGNYPAGRRRRSLAPTNQTTNGWVPPVESYRLEPSYRSFQSSWIKASISV